MISEAPKPTTPPSTGVIKKKFATPPVKIACLSCRASRTRCDGGHPCASCQNRARECMYRPSRRGGARTRKKQGTSPAAAAAAIPETLSGDADSYMDEIMQEILSKPIDVQNYIDPGAGLAQLQDSFEDSDFIFDTLFMPGPLGSGSISGDSISVPSTMSSCHSVPMVRTYSSDSAILDGYYIYIHPYFPILPPPASAPQDQYEVRLQTQIDEFDEDFKPSSPLSLAIAAILALIPCADDINHADHESVVFRRTYSQYLAQSTVESIEMETEIPDSSIEPHRALETEEEAPRAPVHSCLPLEFESIVALDILSVYEYAQRGNLKKMQNRAGQALMAAMAQSLHLDNRDDEFAEARRRVWWMTYVCVCQGSIVSNSKPTFEVFSASFTQRFPTLKIDPEAFTQFIQAQQAILGATQFVVELNKALSSSADLTRIFDRMRELEAFLGGLVEQAETWTLAVSTTTPMDPSEEVLSRSLRCMARIKINSARIKVHRYCAFFDVPVFTKKHCDLNPTKADRGDETGMEEPRQWPSCSCSSFSSSIMHTDPSLSGASGITTPRSDDSHGGVFDAATSSTASSAMIPFSSHQSAKICLRSALNIARAFDELSYPNPTGEPCAQAPCYLSLTSSIVSPRTMPSFACCAMQCAYALLMVRHKTQSMYPPGETTSSLLVDSLLGRLQRGLASILATLENYATAFEALGGMRDQIRGAIEPFMAGEAQM